MLQEQKRGITRRDFGKLAIATSVGIYINFREAVGQIAGNMATVIYNQVSYSINNAAKQAIIKAREIPAAVPETVRGYPQPG